MSSETFSETYHNVPYNGLGVGILGEQVDVDFRSKEAHRQGLERTDTKVYMCVLFKVVVKEKIESFLEPVWTGGWVKEEVIPVVNYSI